MNQINLLILVSLIMMGLSGCDKTKDENVASADVFVKSKKNAQGATVYALAHSVFSYNGMTSVSVTSPDGTTKQIPNFENSGFSFFYEPVDADFAIPAPAAGSYVYSVKFLNGEEITYSNVLSASTIQPINITSLTKNAAGDSIYISWDAVVSTLNYQLLVYKGTTDVLSSNASTMQVSKMGFPTSLLTQKGSGTYTFNLNVFLYESPTSNYIQASTVSSMDLVL